MLGIFYDHVHTKDRFAITKEYLDNVAGGKSAKHLLCLKCNLNCRHRKMTKGIWECIRCGNKRK